MGGGQYISCGLFWGGRGGGGGGGGGGRGGAQYISCGEAKLLGGGGAQIH